MTDEEIINVAKSLVAGTVPCIYINGAEKFNQPVFHLRVTREAPPLGRRPSYFGDDLVVWIGRKRYFTLNDRLAYQVHRGTPGKTMVAPCNKGGLYGIFLYPEQAARFSVLVRQAVEN